MATEKTKPQKDSPTGTKTPSNWDGVPRGERITSSDKKGKKN